MLAGVIDRLLHEETLETKHRDHALSGNMSAYRACHIQPDWLLNYRLEDECMILVVHRTGTHSDLFDEQMWTAHGSAVYFTFALHTLNRVMR